MSNQSSIIIFDENTQNQSLIDFVKKLFKQNLIEAYIDVISISELHLNGTKDDDLFSFLGKEYTAEKIRPILITSDKNQTRRKIEVKLRNQYKISNLFFPAAYSQKSIKEKSIYVVNIFSALIEIIKENHDSLLNMTLPFKTFSITKNEILKKNRNGKNDS